MGGGILSMLAMEMPFFGHLRGVGGLVEGLGNAGNARKKTPGNAGNGWWRRG